LTPDLTDLPAAEWRAEIDRRCAGRAATARTSPPPPPTADRLPDSYAPASDVPREHRRALDDLTPGLTPTQADAHRAASAFAGAWRNGRPLAIGLLLLGPVGAGKTAIAAALAVDCGEPAGVMFATQPHLLAVAKEAMDRRGDESPFARAARVPLLVLDDLGATRDTDWRLDELRTLLYRRHQQSLPCVVTSNRTVAYLTDWLGERTWSRLRSTVDVFVIAGADRRLRGLA
jgi:DNA replication protein DnaC